MKQFIRYAALLGAFAVGTAVQAADTIVVDGAGTTTRWQDLVPTPDAEDTVRIINGARLFVSVPNAVAKEIVIGDSSSPGYLLFDDVDARTLTVESSISFGGSPLSQLDMSAGFTTLAHVLNIKGSFLASGSGTFIAGNGTVVYGGGNQNVQSKVGGAGNDVLYKNLTLSGTGTKTFAANVNVQNVLRIIAPVGLAGSAVRYGPQASLIYDGEGTQTTSNVEWPSSSPLTTPVRISRTGTAARKVVLDSSKTTSSTVTIDSSCELATDTGKDLTARSTITNGGNVSGAGRVILGGTSKQTLSGSGYYGNVTLQNSAGALANGGIRVRGRLVIASGRLDLPETSVNEARLLTHGNTDVKSPNNTLWGSLESTSATQKTDTYYAGKGSIVYIGKFPSAFQVAANPQFTYGDAFITLEGKIVSTEENFGNGAVQGESVTVKIGTLPTQTVGTDSTGVFRATFNTILYKGEYTVTYGYQGGDNLAGPITDASTKVTINARNLLLIPTPVSKTYGEVDPTIQYDYSPKPLVGTDTLTGKLSRVGSGTVQGEQVTSSGWEINNAGTDPVRIVNLEAQNSYVITVAPNRKLTIRRRAMTWVIRSASKTYGQNDPAFGYDVVPANAVVTSLGDSIQNLPARIAADAGKQNANADITIGRGDMRVFNSTLPGGADVTGNYALTINNGKLTINPLAVTVGFKTGSKVFGTADPALEATFTPALVDNVGIGIKDVATGNLDRTKGSNPTSDEVGKYDMKRGDLKIVREGTTTSAYDNYAFDYSQNKFEITRRPMTAKANSVSIAYGDTIPTPSPATGGLVTYDNIYRDKDGNWDTLETWAAVGNWDPRQPVVGDLPTAADKPYKYKITTKPADRNYVDPIPVSPENGEIRITKRNLKMTVDNKSKPYDGFVFDILNYTASYNFVLGDTASVLSGTWTPGGAAVSASQPGVWPITVAANNQTSTKYVINETVDGYLVITEAIGTKVVANPLSWLGNESWSMLIDRATGGSAGVNWNLLDLQSKNGGGGMLTINADDVNKFTVYITTLLPGTQFPGEMEGFDPTRPYEWTIVRADAIEGYADNKIRIYTTGPNSGGGFFANPTFGGTFATKLVTSTSGPQELRVTYTPPSQTDMPNDNIPPLFAYLEASDQFDLLYLEPDRYSLNPQGDKLAVFLKVKNLQQQVNGAQAYIKFSSDHFVSDSKSPNAPVIEPGGGVWDRVVFSYYSGVGDVDTVIGLNFQTVGTADNGTLAKITLTPTRKFTGKSRVTFRHDNATIAGGIPGGTRLSAITGALVLPARVQTRDILINVDDQPPVFNSIAVTQDQYGINRNVKNYNKDDASTFIAVRTGDAAGTVKTAINVSDAGVGLSGAPTLKFTGPGGAIVDVAVDKNNPGGADGVYNYNWEIKSDTPNGEWVSTIKATDMTGREKTADTIKVMVNKNIVQGIVELDTFLGSVRDVAFKSGNGTAVLGAGWTRPVQTTTTEFLPSGEFRNLPGLKTELLKSSDTMSDMTAYLRYGTIGNVSTLLNKINQGTDGLATYLREMWFGFFGAPNGKRIPAEDLAAFNQEVDVLQMDNVPPTLAPFPPRHIDAYVRGRLTAETRTMLDAYPDDPKLQTPSMIAELESALLDEFNEIVLGGNIYDPVRFSTVQPSVLDNDEIVALLWEHRPGADPAPTPEETQRLNRLLLNAAYPSYFYGNLSPVTAKEIGAGVDTASLRRHLGSELYALTLPQNSDWWAEATVPQLSLYTQQRFLGVSFRSATTGMLVRLATEGLNADDTASLNRLLLEDGLAFGLNSLNYMSGPIQPATVTALNYFNANPGINEKMVLDERLMIDFNNVLKSGSRTRSDLEFAYSGMISRYNTRGKFTLINVPDNTSRISAKTTWNLRETLVLDVTVTGDNPTALAYFVNGENVLRPEGVKFDDAHDHYLRGGDLLPNANNAVDLTDLSVFQGYFRTNDPRGDITGEGLSNSTDYSVLRNRIGDVGDPDVNGSNP